MLLIIVFVQILSGFSISIYSITTGPLFLYSVTLLAGLFFLYSGTIDTTKNSILDNISGGSKSSVFPLLNSEYYVKFYCNKLHEHCKFEAYGHNGTIKAQLIEGNHVI